MVPVAGESRWKKKYIIGLLANLMIEIVFPQRRSSSRQGMLLNILYWNQSQILRHHQLFVEYGILSTHEKKKATVNVDTERGGESV